MLSTVASTLTSTITTRDIKFMEHAHRVAQSSKLMMRHGAVCVANNRVISTGTNHYRYASSDGFIPPGCSCHAEMDALRKLLPKGANAFPLPKVLKGSM